MKTVMKKMFSLLLVAVLLISAVPTAFAAEHADISCPICSAAAKYTRDHTPAACGVMERVVYKCTSTSCEYNKEFYYDVPGTALSCVGGYAPTCTADQTCINCGTVLNARLDHDLTIANCYANQRCKREGCNYEKPNSKLDHTWDNGVAQPAATCFSAGKKIYTCTTCPEGQEATKEETIPATGNHVWGNASCTEPAHCTTPNCDAVNGTELGHAWREVTKDDTKAADCTTPGKKNFECACGATKSETISVLGHDIGSEGKCLRTGCGYKETARVVVDFYLDYNEHKNPVTKTVAKGTKLYDIYTPSRSSYAFEGWYTVSGNRVSESATVTEDSAYFAKWTQMAPHEVYVKFYTHGNTKTVVKYVDMHHYAKDGVISLDDLYTVAKKNFKARNNEDLYIQGPFTSSEWDIFTENSAYRNTREKIEVSQTSTTVIHAMVRNVDDSSSSSSSKADSSNPKTGDMIFAPMMVLGASAACLATLFYLNKKRAY